MDFGLRTYQLSDCSSVIMVHLIINRISQINIKYLDEYMLKCLLSFVFSFLFFSGNSDKDSGVVSVRQNNLMWILFGLVRVVGVSLILEQA